MQGLVKLLLNSLCGVQIRRIIDQSYKYKSQHWVETEYDDNKLDYWRLPSGNYIVKLRKDDGLDGDNDTKKTLPSHLGAFILSNSERIMNNFIKENNGFYKNSIYYGDTDSLYVEKKYWDVLDKANLVGKNLCQCRFDYETGGIFYGFFLVPKINYCLTINEFGVIQQHMTFEGFNDCKRLLYRSENFDMLEVKKISAMLPKSWKKLFNNGIVISEKMRRCDKWRNKKLCATCINQINEIKEFEANRNLSEREAPKEFVYMLPFSIE